MLIEEIEMRTDLSLSSSETLGTKQCPSILLCLVNKAPDELRRFVAAMHVPEQAEGFAIAVNDQGKHPVVVLAGRDERGIRFSAGRLLLQLKLKKKQLELPANYQIATAPRYLIRGHQIAFRNLSHCYDAWTPAIYEQYMRELAVFGANAFETTSFSIDGKSGPHAKRTGGEIATSWSRICAEYGFSFWLFPEAIGGQGKSAKQEQAAIESRLEILRAIPHLDHFYLTGGDEGTSHRRPDLILEKTGQFAIEARKIHPQLGIWASNQGFGPELNNWLFEYLQQQEPKWLTGVVYGPWSRILPDGLRARVPEQYPVRRYPDIGHCLRAQYPLPGWDRALAQTLGREPFAPRSKGHARIHNLYDEYTEGFVTYSDGVTDWEDPGPGGFYDDLGCAWKQPHLVKPKPLWDDPAGITTPREAHASNNANHYRLSCLDVEEALNATPLRMHYEQLDPDATYRVRVTYLGRYDATVRLVANSKHEIHGAYGHTVKDARYAAGYSDRTAAVKPTNDSPTPVVTPLEFVIPREATQDGTLELTWQRFTGRGTQVAEVWLIKQ